MTTVPKNLPDGRYLPPTVLVNADGSVVDDSHPLPVKLGTDPTINIGEVKLLGDDGAVVAGSAADVAAAAGSWTAIWKYIASKMTAVVLAAGTAIIGKVGIDQTTPGTTNGVVVKSAAGVAITYPDILALANHNAYAIAVVDSNGDQIVPGKLSTTAYSDASRMAVDERDSLAVSGSVTSAATLFTQDMLGYESITVQVTSAGSGCTLTYETSDDNSNWVTSTGFSSAATAGQTPTANSTATGMMQFPRRGRYFRARVSTYGSGTVTVVGSLSKVPAAVVTSVSLQGTSTTVAAGYAAHAAAINGAPVRIGARARTSNVTAVTNDQVVDAVATLVGAAVQKPYSIPEADWNYAAANLGIVNTTAAVTIAAAAAAGIRNYITSIQVMAEALGTATELAVRDGAAGTVLWRIKVGTGGLTGCLHVAFPSPLKSTAATLLEVVTLTASGTGAVYFNAQGYTAP